MAGPGTGKTYLFRKLLERDSGSPDRRLVLTFINNLKNDLDHELGHLARVATLHGYCQRLLHQHAKLRGELTENFECYPGLVSLIKRDWECLNDSEAPKFVEEMRHLDCPREHQEFYFSRASFYDAVDFDDSVFRTFERLSGSDEHVPTYDLVLIDEFQDFNKLEAALIDLLADHSPIIVAGDDDQALYSQLRGASWEYIRSHYRDNEYEVFELPYCMRCTEVIVDAVNDVIEVARAKRKLTNRIEKPYRFYEPNKGDDSRQYPRIDLVCTTVQRLNANYFGRYIERKVSEISNADIELASKHNEPVALVIGSSPYLPQIKTYLIDVGLVTPDDQETPSEREKALEILFDKPESNLGWRIILACGDPSIAAERIRAANDKGVPLVALIPEAEREAVGREADALAGTQPPEMETNNGAETALNIKLTSFEGSKGLSSQHVFLVGLHAGDLPRDPKQIQDIEICRFVVGLTRTRKKCTIMCTDNFAGKYKKPSPFLFWIRKGRYNIIKIDAKYWNK